MTHLTDQEWNRLTELTMLEVEVAVLAAEAKVEADAADDMETRLYVLQFPDSRLAQLEAEVRQETQKKYQEFYKKLNDEAREKLLSVLTPAQRKKLEDLTGQKFEWQFQAQPAQPVSGGSAPLK